MPAWRPVSRRELVALSDVSGSKAHTGRQARVHGACRAGPHDPQSSPGRYRSGVARRDPPAGRRFPEGLGTGVNCHRETLAVASLHPTPHEPLGLLVHEVHVAALEPAARQYPIRVLHQLDEPRLRTIHDAVVRVRRRPRPCLRIEGVGGPTRRSRAARSRVRRCRLLPSGPWLFAARRERSVHRRWPGLRHPRDRCPAALKLTHPPQPRRV